MKRKSNDLYSNLGINKSKSSLSERLNTSSKMAAKGVEKKSLDIKERTNTKMSNDFVSRMNKANGTSIYKRKG